MLNPKFRTVLEGELRRLGCPRGETRRLVLEMAEHSADLRAEGAGSGVEQQELEGWVERRLGEPLKIAAQMVEMMRRRSWSSRHPVLAFCVGPILVYFGLTLLLVLACLPALDGAASGAWIAAHPAAATSVLQGILLTVGAVFLVLQMRRALRCVQGGRWAIAVVAASVVSLPMLHVQVAPFSVILGWGLWSVVSVPAVLLVCAGAALWERRAGAG